MKKVTNLRVVYSDNFKFDWPWYSKICLPFCRLLKFGPSKWSAEGGEYKMLFGHIYLLGVSKKEGK